MITIKVWRPKQPLTGRWTILTRKKKIHDSLSVISINISKQLLFMQNLSSLLNQVICYLFHLTWSQLHQPSLWNGSWIRLGWLQNRRSLPLLLPLITWKGSSLQLPPVPLLAPASSLRRSASNEPALLVLALVSLYFCFAQFICIDLMFI